MKNDFEMNNRPFISITDIDVNSGELMIKIKLSNFGKIPGKLNLSYLNISIDDKSNEFNYLTTKEYITYVFPNQEGQFICILNTNDEL